MVTEAQLNPISYGKSWVVTLTAGLFFFYSFIQLNLFNSINAELMRAFNLNAPELGQLSAMYFYANALFLFPAGLLLDRFSTKKWLLSAIFLSIIGTFLFGMSTVYWLAALSRFMVGTAAAFSFLSCVRLASRWFPPHKMALVTGLIVTMAMLGGLVAQTPLAALAALIGWRAAVQCNVFLGILIFILVGLVVQNCPPHFEMATAAEKNHLKTMGFWKSIKLVIFNLNNWLGGIYSSLLNFPIFLLGALWGIPYLTQIHHLSLIQASYATMLLFIGVIVGSPLFGWFSDRIHRRVLPMILGAILSLVAMLVLLYTPGLTLTEIIVLFFLVGLLTSSQVLSYPTIAELNPTSVTSTALSIVSFTLMFSGVLCQPFFGWMLELNWDHTIINGSRVYSPHDFLNGLLMMPISFVLSIFIAWKMKETYCRSQV